MTTLHGITVIACLCLWPTPDLRQQTPDCPIHLPPPEPEPPPYRCPNENCANRDGGRWGRNETGTYAEYHTVTFRNNGLWDEGWDNNETDMHDAGDWLCYHCDTRATPDIAEWIDDNR